LPDARSNRALGCHRHENRPRPLCPPRFGAEMPALLFARHAICCKLVESRENDRVPQQTRGVPGRAGKRGKRRRCGVLLRQGGRPIL